MFGKIPLLVSLAALAVGSQAQVPRDTQATGRPPQPAARAALSELSTESTERQMLAFEREKHRDGMALEREKMALSRDQAF